MLTPSLSHSLSLARARSLALSTHRDHSLQDFVRERLIDIQFGRKPDLDKFLDGYGQKRYVTPEIVAGTHDLSRIEYGTPAGPFGGPWGDPRFAAGMEPFGLATQPFGAAMQPHNSAMRASGALSGFPTRGSGGQFAYGAPRQIMGAGVG